MGGDRNNTGTDGAIGRRFYCLLKNGGQKIMKKIAIIFIFLLSSNIAFAQTTVKRYLKNGDHIAGETIDATGFTHGVEMRVPGTAWISNSIVKNANTNGKDGRGIVASGVGSKIIIFNTQSNNNTEDGYRSINGGELTIAISSANNNGKNGFFAGKNSKMHLSNITATGNKYGVMGAENFEEIVISNSNLDGNTAQGMQLIQGDLLSVTDSFIKGNNTSQQMGEDFGGVAVYGVLNASISRTEISGNFSSGFFADSDTTYNDDPSRVFLEEVIIANNGPEGVKSRGDSIVTIINSQLEGLCLEEPDPKAGTLGIITVNGEGVLSGQDCPN